MYTPSAHLIPLLSSSSAFQQHHTDRDTNNSSPNTNENDVNDHDDQGIQRVLDNDHDRKPKTESMTVHVKPHAAELIGTDFRAPAIIAKFLNINDTQCHSLNIIQNLIDTQHIRWVYGWRVYSMPPSFSNSYMKRINLTKAVLDACLGMRKTPNILTLQESLELEIKKLEFVHNQLKHSPNPKDNFANKTLSATSNYKFTFIELFAGIGGFRLGMSQLGGKCIFASELSATARETYIANFMVDGFTAGDHEILVGVELHIYTFLQKIPTYNLFIIGYH